VVSERYTSCPALGAHEIGTWLHQQYGPSTDASWMAMPDGTNQFVGWIFPAPAAWAAAAGVEAGTVELVAVPMWTDADGRPAGPAYLRLAACMAILEGDEAA
jgi:hypothetical protein